MRISLLIISLLLSINLNAQRLSYGFEHHIGLSSFTHGLLPFHLKPSSSTGFVIDNPFSKKLLLLSGLYIHFSGARTEIYWPYNSDYVKVKEALRQSYLRIPVIFKVDVGDKRNIYLGAGGFFNLFLSRKISSDNDEYPISISPWMVLELDQQDFGIILRQEIVKVFDRFEFSYGLQEELSMNPVARETIPYGFYLFGGIRLNKPKSY